MLAYLFWHWPRPGQHATEYVPLQRAFHAALAQEPPDGFTGSRSFAIRGAQWAGGGGDAYEDWYLLRDSAALDALNSAALSRARRRPHDAAAAAAGGGSGGLYRLRAGSVLSAPGFAYWLGKPEGLSYEETMRSLAPLGETAGSALWMRQMVLGPAPELCLHVPEPVALPAGFDAVEIRLRPVWPCAEASLPEPRVP